MNKLAILVLLWSLSFEVLGQKYKPVRVAFGLGITNGLISYFEPSVRITDKFSLAYRSESGGFVALFDPKNYAMFTSYQISSQGGVIQYYFHDIKDDEDKNDLRFFIGVGFAKYSYHLKANYSWADESGFGFFPRFGLDWRHLTACVDFNLINSFTEYTLPPQSFQSSEKVNKSYFSVRGGFVIGGGKKKNATQAK